VPRSQRDSAKHTQFLDAGSQGSNHMKAAERYTAILTAFVLIGWALKNLDLCPAHKVDYPLRSKNCADPPFRQRD
jgi:hypothetical protein